MSDRKGSHQGSNGTRNPEMTTPGKPNSPTAGSSITPEMVNAFVASKDDFGFEIRVKAVLEKHNASNVRHGWSYIDPVEQKPRQFDLRADLLHFRNVRRLRLALECKNLDPVSPLVISGTARTAEEAYHHFIKAGTLPHGVYEAGYNVRGVYNRYSFVGRNINRAVLKGGSLEVAKRDDETDIYKRWSQALASAVDPSKEALTDGVLETAVIPAVVVPDDSLWQVSFDENGNVQDKPKLVEMVSIFVGHEVVLKSKSLWMKLSHVDFFTISGLSRFLAHLMNTTADWNEWFPDCASRYEPPVH